MLEYPSIILIWPQLTKFADILSTKYGNHMKSFSEAVLSDRKLALTIIIAALGYFVDIYDLVLFSVVRLASLRDLGLSGDDLTTTGAFLLNMQLLGFLVGGLIWGIMGDRIGRKKVLFGSILLYSLANISNAFVTSVDQYALCRLLAGIGLAGEIGAGITLVAELMPRHLRGYGTTIIATVGIFGGVLAGFTGHMMDWQTAYIFGGIMGLCLLALRVSVSESGLFNELKRVDSAPRGNILILFSTRDRLVRYLACILIGLPTWYAVGVLITFAPEIAKNLGVVDEIKVATALPLCYLGLVIGDFACGLISQRLQSRKKVIAAFITLAGIVIFGYFNLPFIPYTAESYYAFCLIVGIFMGYWVLMLTTAAEQFGTNIRATVATSVPNFVRGAGVIAISAFVALKPLGVINSVQLVAVGAFVVAFAALAFLKETFHTDLDFVER